jgi:hypothetical protein
MEKSDREWYETRIKETLYLLTPESGASVDYAKGMLVGLSAGIMACNREFSLLDLKPFLPRGFRHDAIPETWKEFLV